MTTPAKPDLVTIAELAKKLGISGRRAQQLVKDGVLPAPETRGAYDMEACMTAYLNYALGRELRSEPQRTRLDRARASREEFQLERLRGDYVLVSEVKAEAFARARARAARDALDQMRS